MDDRDITRLPAISISQLVTSGRLTATEILEAFLAAIARRNPAINAFAEICEDHARQAAAEVDARIAGGQTDMVLAGVPFHAKDLIQTKGVQTAFGSNAMDGNIPQKDAAPVAQLRRAGAVLIGKTTTPEFGSDVFTASMRHGITGNPWNPQHTSGGSSGGAGAAVAAGLGPLALSTDGGGSSRVPASCCGVLGLKPTLGLVSNDCWPLKFDIFTFIGANARYPKDLAALLSSMNGPSNLDPWTIGRTKQNYEISENPGKVLDGLRIQYAYKMGNKALDSDVAARFDAMLHLLTERGARLSEVPPTFPWGSDIWPAVIGASMTARFAELAETKPDLLGPTILAGIEFGRKVPAEVLREGPLERTRVFNRVQALFETSDLIVSPTLSAPPPKKDSTSFDQLIINGEEVGSVREQWFTYPQTFNLTGHPAISIPIGFTPDGLPVGMQAVGPYFSEQRLLDLAAAIDEMVPWTDKWPELDG